MREIYINIDAYNNDIIKTIQGNNNAEVYKIYVLLNKRRLDLTGKTVKMAYLRIGTGEGDVINLNVTNTTEGEITLQITNSISKRDGVYSCQLAIYGADGFLEHTATFGLTVEANIFTKIAGEIADSKDFTYLERILEEASKLSEKLKENTASATNANSNLESNIIEANNINSKLLENTSTATSLNSNLESNINLAKEVKETIKDLDTKNIEATEKIQTLTGLNSKAIELSNNIQQGLPLNSELIKNTESAKTANNELIATNNDAKAKKTDLDNSLEEAKKYISGLDGSQNIPKLRLDVTELQNGLKSNQALAYKGSSISAENTLEGRTEGMRIGGRTLVNISPKGISDCSSISAFNHNYQEVKVEQGDGFVKCTQPLAKKYNILGYDNVNMLKTNTYYLHMAYVEILNNPSNDTCEFQLGNFDTFKTIKISQGKGIVAALTKTNSNLSGGNSKWISLMLGDLNSTGENRSFKVFNIATYEISEKEASLEIESLIKLYPIKCNGMKSFGESEREGDKYKISILSSNAIKIIGKYVNYANDGLQDDNYQSYVIKCDGVKNIAINLKDEEINRFGVECWKSDNFKNQQDFVGNLNYFPNKFTKQIFTPLEGTKYIKIYLSNNMSIASKKLSIEVFVDSFPNGDYREDKKDILIKEPLKSVGDIKDIIYEDDGKVKIDRYVGKIIINGNSDDGNNYIYYSDKRFIINIRELNINKKDRAYVLCDKLPYNYSAYSTIGQYGISGYGDSSASFVGRWDLGKTVTDRATFIEYLKTNPITIYYELDTPVTEVVENCVDIDLDTFQEKTYFSIENSIKGSLDFKVPSNIASIVQNMAKEVNNIWDVINNLLVPSLIETNKNIAMATIKNNLK
ncbi:BppU family phage baseplate upper protein [Clostridium perfringens]|nr:BppU family phage baseplate upper protein [Clostridium perfringens]MDK0711044.1 BppU family phage baseplate upper protein [Clostridium perfringens]